MDTLYYPSPVPVEGQKIWGDTKNNRPFIGKIFDSCTAKINSTTLLTHNPYNAAQAKSYVGAVIFTEKLYAAYFSPTGKRLEN